MTIWEIRFRDGRGASLYTAVDVSERVGDKGPALRVPVAAAVIDATALEDARACFSDGRVRELVADVEAIAYVIRHD